MDDELTAERAHPGPPIHVREWGEGPLVVLVHGALTDGEKSWEKQRPLADRWTLRIPDRRGFGANPPAPSSDFEVDAEDIAVLAGDGAHVVGHSYGAIVALFAAARRPASIRSLAVLEPPAHAIMRGDPQVEREIADFLEQRATVVDPEAFHRAMLERLGAPTTDLPSPLPPRLEHDVRLLMAERPPWDAPIPVEAVRDASIPLLVVSGGHNALFEQLCDALAAAVGPTAHRAVLPGRGHAVQRAPEFNDRLEAFLLSAS